jgi:hypothetical protein
VAAASVLQCLDQGVTGNIDVALANVAAHFAAGLDRRPSPDEPRRVTVAPPRARTRRGRAANMGADTDAVLGEL